MPPAKKPSLSTSGVKGSSSKPSNRGKRTDGAVKKKAKKITAQMPVVEEAPTTVEDAEIQELQGLFAGSPTKVEPSPDEQAASVAPPARICICRVARAF